LWSGTQEDEDAGCYHEGCAAEPHQGDGVYRQVQEAKLVEDHRGEYLTGEDERHGVRRALSLGVRIIEAAR
jgi:hypothetical protein